MEQPLFYQVGKKYLPHGPPSKTAVIRTSIHMSTWFYENGHISANYGLILKIQSFAYSGLRARPVGPSIIGARDVTRMRDITKSTQLLGNFEATRSGRHT